MPNRLISEKSPYLQQHAHNPVDWYAWNDEAFAKARAADKPVNPAPSTATSTDSGRLALSPCGMATVVNQ